MHYCTQASPKSTNANSAPTMLLCTKAQNHNRFDPRTRVTHTSASALLPWRAEPQAQVPACSKTSYSYREAPVQTSSPSHRKQHTQNSTHVWYSTHSTPPVSINQPFRPELHQHDITLNCTTQVYPCVWSKQPKHPPIPSITSCKTDMATHSWCKVQGTCVSHPVMAIHL